MEPTRRTALRAIAGAVAAPAFAARAAADNAHPPIVDTHQHLWTLPDQRLAWLGSASDVLRRTYNTKDYLDATRGLGVAQAVYMEVDVVPDDHRDEAERVLKLCQSPDAPTRAAVLGGRPSSSAFAEDLKRLKAQKAVKGVRQVLHSGLTPPGYCLSPEFIKGIQALGREGLSFDLCLRPDELGDAVKLVDACPDTCFILDHCGNADPNAFRKGRGEKPSHDPEQWKRHVDALAARPKVICKISGVVAKAPRGWTADDLAPPVNHCLDSFGPDRVVFGGDWPVCLLGAPLREWVEALRVIVSNRPRPDQRKLWHDNAVRVYGLDA